MSNIDPQGCGPGFGRTIPLGPCIESGSGKEYKAFIEVSGNLEKALQTSGKSTRSAQILRNTIDVTFTIFDHLRKLPRRKLFFKSYNRRPMRKVKRTKIFADIAVAAVSAAYNIEVISSQPEPTYPPGSSPLVRIAPIVSNYLAASDAREQFNRRFIYDGPTWPKPGLDED